MLTSLNHLNIVRREEWGEGLSPEWPSSPTWTPVRHTPRILVVHHTVTSNKQGNASTVRAVWRYHARTQNWGDIRYHYLIGQDGVIYEGRWRGGQRSNIFVEGGQSMVSNTGKVGVVLLGQFEPNISYPTPGEPTPEALNSLVKLLGAIAYDLELDPLGQTYHETENKTYSVVGGHRDHYQTTCPGGSLYALMLDIREDVAEEIQRLRENENTTERTVDIAAASNQMAWGKSAWPNLLWGNEHLFSGAWWSTVYAGLIEIPLPAEVIGGQITGLELVLTGQNAKYLREPDGTWQVTILDKPLRGGTPAKISFQMLQNALSVAAFSPRLLRDALQPEQQNLLTIEPSNLSFVQQAVTESGYLTLRLEGPADGRRLFAWSGVFGRGGPVLKVNFRIKPAPQPDLSDVVVKDIAFERTQQERVRLAALVANVGQAQTPGSVEVSFFVDDQFLTTGIADPLPMGKSQAVRADETFFLTGVHMVTAIVDEANLIPEEQEDNNSRIRQVDFGGERDHLADVIITGIKLDKNPVIAKDKVIFEAVIKNIGTALTEDVVGVAFLVDGQYITFGAVEPMVAGETQIVRAVAPWQAMAGQHKLLAIVDDIDRLEEKSESNNNFEVEFQVLEETGPALPDSTIESVGFETDSSEKITLIATVANLGNVVTPDVVGVAFFVDERYVTYGVARPMSPRSTEVVRAVQAIPLSGPHKITAIVDDVNRYSEISDQNNVLIQQIVFP